MDKNTVILLGKNEEHARGIGHMMNCIGNCYEILRSHTLEELKMIVAQHRSKIALIIVDLKEYYQEIDKLMKWQNEEKALTWIVGIVGELDSLHLLKCLRYGIVDFISLPFAPEKIKHVLCKIEKIMELQSNPRLVSAQELQYLCVGCCCGGDTNKSLPKGYNQRTYKRVFSHLLQWSFKKFTSMELAEELGISRITARRYLDLLEVTDKIEMEMVYGKTGRPTNFYGIKAHKSQVALGGSSIKIQESTKERCNEKIRMKRDE